MSPTGRGRRRRLLTALAIFVAASSIPMIDRFSRAAELQVLDETQSTNQSLILEYVVLRWTAPGDDGVSGRASHYDLRYSTYSIAGTDTAGWWNGATKVSLWNKIPALPGQPDSLRLIGLTPGNRYFAMLRTCDEVPNWSPFSNLAVIQSTDLTAPKAVADLRVR